MTGFEHAAFKDLETRVSALETSLRDFITSQTAHLQSLHSLLEMVEGKKARTPTVVQQDTALQRYADSECTLCHFPRKAHLGALLSCPVTNVPENQVYQGEEEDPGQ